MPNDARPLGGGSDDLPIDVDLLKVLASDSRRDILRLLHKRRMTLSEMSASLQLKKATVLEHLRKLTDAGLIRRIDDDRIWVYYELTHRGGRLVDPGRTRFFLVLAWAAAAAIVLSSVVALALVFEERADTVTPPALAVGMGGLRADVETGAIDGLVAGAPGALRARVLADDASQAPITRALLVAPQDATRIESGRLAGIPLSSTAVNETTLELRAQSALPAGDYLLYVADANGRDNTGAMPRVRVAAFQVEGPAVAWRLVDEHVTVRVTRDGEVVNGTLVLVGENATTVPLAQGVASLDATALDALKPGPYRLQAFVTGRAEAVPLGETLVVRDPAIAPARFDVAAAERAHLDIHLDPRFTDEVAVTVDGEEADVLRREPGLVRITLNATDPGEREVRVARAAPFIVHVHPAVDLVLSDVDAANATLGATTVLGAPLQGVALDVDGVRVGMTDANGTLRFARPASGESLFFATLPTGEVVEQLLLVNDTGFVSLAVVPRIDVGEPTLTSADARVPVELDASGTSQPILVTASIEGRPIASTRAVGTTNLTLLVPLDAGTTDIAVRANVVDAAPRLRVEGATPSADPGTEPSASPATPTTPTATPTTATPPSSADDGEWSAPEVASTDVRRVAQDAMLVTVHLAIAPTTAPTAPTFATPTTVGAGEPAAEVPASGAALMLAAIVVAVALRRRFNRS